MNKLLAQVGFLILSALTLAACASSSGKSSHPDHMSATITRYQASAKQELGPYFKKAGVQYPPKQISLIAFKNSHRLLLWARDDGAWHYIRTFPILAASGGLGPKLLDGDRQVPEGVYHIVQFNPDSHFDLSIELNYPNAFDRSHAALDGRDHVGNQIFIHGSNRSIGCIPIGNHNIEQLFVLSYLVGMDNINVIVAPNDLRYHQPIYGRVHPKWLPQLYAQIKQALRPYS